jgi:hypothetical protein
MDDWTPAEWRSEVELMTTMLRTSEAFPFWSDLRRQLQEQGIEPEQALLVESYDEPPAGDQVGAVVDATGRVLAYRESSGEWTWDDLTDRWEDSDFADQVRVGLAMLRDSNGC